MDSIPLATNFEDRIHAALDSCQVVLVLIGTEWLSARLPSGERRLDDEHDYLRQEVAAALERRRLLWFRSWSTVRVCPAPRTCPPTSPGSPRSTPLDLNHKRWRADVGTLSEIAQRYDKWWSRVLNWLRARAIPPLILVLAAAIVAAAIIAGGGVFDGSSQPPPGEPTVRLRTSELETATNSRYGFSFQYPVTWERNDPVNGDGLAAIGPEPGLEVLGYGSPSDAWTQLPRIRSIDWST